MTLTDMQVNAIHHLLNHTAPEVWQGMSRVELEAEFVRIDYRLDGQAGFELSHKCLRLGIGDEDRN